MAAPKAGGATGVPFFTAMQMALAPPAASVLSPAVDTAAIRAAGGIPATAGAPTTGAGVVQSAASQRSRGSTQSSPATVLSQVMGASGADKLG